MKCSSHVTFSAGNVRFCGITICLARMKKIALWSNIYDHYQYTTVKDKVTLKTAHTVNYLDKT